MFVQVSIWYSIFFCNHIYLWGSPAKITVDYKVKHSDSHRVLENTYWITRHFMYIVENTSSRKQVTLYVDSGKSFGLSLPKTLDSGSKGTLGSIPSGFHFR